MGYKDPDRPVSVKQDEMLVATGRKHRPGIMRRSSDGEFIATASSPLLTAEQGGHVLNAAGTNSSGGGGGGPAGQVDRFNPVIDDISRGSVVEDWVPRDIKGQNRMWRLFFARGIVEGPAVETLAEICWSDFEMTGVADSQVLDTFYSAKEAVHVERYMEDISKEIMVMGRCAIQLVMHPTLGIWTDMLIHDSDYIKVTPIPRTGYMPKIDLLPSPDVQNWARSQDPRDLASKKDLPADLLKSLSANTPVSLDPLVTAYIPRRSYFNDMIGTSAYVRLIPIWALEKSLINATVTGHRRRAGPITHISMGSENWEPTPAEMESVLQSFTAAEEDNVGAVVVTRQDVTPNKMGGGSGEIWKWSDEWSFIQEAKMRAMGFSEGLLSGETTIQQMDQAMTIFMERVKAHRRYVTEQFLLQKFFRALSHVHGFRKRTEAELSHRVRVNPEEHELILPTIVYKKALEPSADQSRADLFSALEEKGIPVEAREWSQALGGGDPAGKFASYREDLRLRAKLARVTFIRKQIDGLAEGAENEKDLLKKLKVIENDIESLPFGDEDATPGAEAHKDSTDTNTKDSTGKGGKDKAKASAGDAEAEASLEERAAAHGITAKAVVRNDVDAVDDLSKMHSSDAGIAHGDVQFDSQGKVIGGGTGSTVMTAHGANGRAIKIPVLGSIKQVM